MAEYLSLNYWSNPLQLVTIDLTSSEVSRVTIAGGRNLNKGTAWISSLGVLLVGTSGPGVLSEVSPALGTSRTVGSCAETILYAACLSADTRAFWGTYPHGHVVEYNPATEAFIDHGVADPTFTDPQYGYTIGVDPACTHVYLSLGQAPWYLAVLELATGDYTLYFAQDGDTGGNVYEALDGSALWYWRKQADGTQLWYTLVSGVVTLSSDARPTFKAWDAVAGYDFGLAAWFTRQNLEIDLADAVPTTQSPTATIRWRAVGEPEFNSIVLSDIPLSPNAINRLYAYNSTQLLCLSAAYGPVFLYTPTSGAVSILGFPQYSLYDACKIGAKWYLSGYSAVTLEYDPAQPWTLTASSTDHTITNPRVVLSVSKYHHFSVTYGGLLYVAVHHERDSVGGELGWYDPVTVTDGSLRAGLETLDPNGLVICGDLLVYSGEDITGGEGLLVVIDPTTHAIVRTINPLEGEGISEAGWLVTAGNDVIGLTGSRAYRVTPAAGTIVWTATLPGVAFNVTHTADQRAELAPDGWIYLYCGNSIFKLSPTTGGTIKIIEDTTPGPLLWFDGAAFVYGTTNLRKLLV